jgi:hypothetical protein
MITIGHNNCARSKMSSVKLEYAKVQPGVE